MATEVEGELRYRTLVEHVPDAIVVLDVDLGRFVLVNPQAERLFGMSRARLLTLGPADVSPMLQPDGRPSAEAAKEMIDLASEDRVHRFEWLHQRGDGSPVECEVRLLRLPAGDRRLVQGSITEVDSAAREITARVGAEATLHSSEERFRALVTQAPVGFFMADASGANVFANQALAEIVGREAAQLRGRGWVSHVHPVDRARVVSGWDVAVAQGTGWSGEFRVVTPDGTVRWVAASGRAMRDAQQQVTGFLGTCTDVTARREAEQARRDAAAHRAARRAADAAAERLRALLEDTPAIVWVFSGPDHVIEVANRLARASVGHRQPLLGLPVRKAIPEAEGQGVPDLLDLVSTRGEAIMIDEMPVTVQDAGGPRTGVYQAIIQPLFDDGRVIGVFSHAVDITQQVGARKEVEAAQRRLEALVAGLSAIVWEADADSFTCSFVSEQAEALLGYPIERWMSERDFWATSTHPDDRDALVSTRAEAVRAGRDHELVRRAVAADGRVLWLRDLVHVVVGAGGRPSLLQGVTVDVTDRQLAEVARAETEARFKAFSDGASEALFMIDRDARITWANATASRWLGYAVGELAGMAVPDIDPLFPRERYQQVFERSRVETVPPFESVHRRSDGDTFPVEISVTTLAFGDQSSLFAAVRDISDRKEAEARLQASEQRFRTLIEQASEGIVLFLETGEWQYASPGAARILGYDPDELVGSKGWSLVHPDDLEHTRGVFGTLLGAPKTVLAVELRMRHKDGTYRWLEVVATNLVQEPQVGALLANIGDVTDRKRREQATGVLAEAGRVLTEHEQLTELLEALARAGVPALGDVCVIALLGPDRVLRRAAVAGPSPELERRIRDLPLPDGDNLMRQAIRTARPILVNDVPREGAPADTVRSLLGVRASMTVPLNGTSGAIGVLAFAVTDPSRRYERDDLEVAEELGRRIALAIERARLHREQETIARILQQGLLPARLPAVPGLELTACYRPLGAAAGTVANVGGDFYDVFEIPGGWALTVGDVCGKGPAAAQLTAVCRNALRTAALAERGSPAQVLALLNAVVLSQQLPDGMQFCTLNYICLQPLGEDRMQLCLARGGHPPIVLVRAGGRLERPNPAGQLVGILPDATFADYGTELRPGDLLVAFTDGVTEARRDGVLFGDRRLEQLIVDHHEDDLQTIVNRVEQAVVRFQDGPLRDDLAILAVRFTGPRG